MEFSLWMLSQCGLGRTNPDCSGMAGSPPCSSITLCGGEFSSEQTKPLCSFFLVNYRETTLSLHQGKIDQVFASVPAGCWAEGRTVQLPGLALHKGLSPLGAADAELALHRLTSSPVFLASRSYCKVCQPKHFSCVVCTVPVFGGPCLLR